MAKKKKGQDSPNGIILYAKRSGLTSFSSLWSVKKALGTDKVGHTGTLDSFAEGLLVVLSGSLTHLVSHVTAFKKTYLAVICFGEATDSLDPFGRVTGTGRPLSEDEVRAACSRFTGAQLQIPPVFSALHVDGKRASDIARSGEEVKLQPRQVFIYRNELLSYKAADGDSAFSYALVEVECSKGTYIRALARDMASLFGTVAHLSALRRTQVGPFSLEDAACFSMLDDFTIDNAVGKEKIMRNGSSEPQKDGEPVFSDIRNHLLSFTPRLSFRCGLKAEKLDSSFEKAYLNGRPLSSRMFVPLEMDLGVERDFNACQTYDERSVFYTDGQFAGVTRIASGRLEYSFVVPKKKRSIRTFSWTDLQQGSFPHEWKEKGTAISVGGFDALHRGHLALVNAVLAQKKLVPGIVLFRHPFRAEDGTLVPSAMSLSQRLELLESKGVAFAIVVDFSPTFARTEGVDFFSVLAESCGMTYLAEGRDFRCGWKGAFGQEQIAGFAGKTGFSFDIIDDVEVANGRASSSRVRSAVLAADFTLAKELLGRPFEYDCRSLNFVRQAAKADDEGCSLSARLTGCQVYPPDGKYDVEISFGKGSGSLQKGDCLIKDGSVSIRLSSGALPHNFTGTEQPVSLLF
ncbi:MAG: tRNA pseudouridine(55) synthase TruB [Treponema sp.]|nr:tRNA pseudouridine(55) synthase TruB [Treponema sp.]